MSISEQVDALADTNAPDFEAFVAATSVRMFRTAYAVAGDHHQAEDAVQTAYAIAYDRWPRICRLDDPVAYVRKVVVNQVLTWHRRRRRETTTDQVPDIAVVEAYDSVDVPDRLWAAVRNLPARQRAVIALRYYEHLSEAEIADTLSVRPGTVKSTAAAALGSLRRSLGENF